MACTFESGNGFPSVVSIQVRRHRLCRACIEDTSGSNHYSPASSCSFDDDSDEPASAGGDLGARDIIRTFGKMRITVRIRDRRIEAGTDIPKTQLDANFSQSPTHRNFLLNEVSFRRRAMRCAHILLLQLNAEFMVAFWPFSR